jgi:hypothetical protein
MFPGNTMSDMPRYSLKNLLLAVTVIAITIAFGRAVYIGLTHVERAKNLSHVSWLPPSATNVSFYKSYNFTAYEFDISEGEFRRWASWYGVQPIGAPIRVWRYNFPDVESRDLGSDPSFDELEEWEATRTATVTDGLGFVERRPNGGGISVAYDRTTGRAYFQSNPR